MIDDIRVLKAEWDLRHKSKLLRIEGFVLVDSFDDVVTASIAKPQGINTEILLINVIIKPSKGPKKRQPAPFHLIELTTGDEPWTSVQTVLKDGSSDSIPITTLQWAGKNGHAIIR